MTMHGKLTGFSLQDVLLLIGAQGRTGELDLESGNNIGSMLFHEGKILHASSPYSRAIGDLLVEDGLISEADLIRTLALQKNNHDVPLGVLLLKTGTITFEIIEMMVHEQIRDAIKEFASWKGVLYSFTHKDIKPYDRISLPVSEFVGAEVLLSAVRYLSTPIQVESPAAPPLSRNSMSSE
jgi:hypothetical protein